MLIRERSIEDALIQRLEGPFEKLGVRIASLAWDPATKVVDLHVEVPSWSDRALRHDVLEAIAELERSQDHAIIVDPTLTWSDEDEQ